MDDGNKPSTILIDSFEHRFRKIYPIRLFYENYMQFMLSLFTLPLLLMIPMYPVAVLVGSTRVFSGELTLGQFLYETLLGLGIVALAIPLFVLITFVLFLLVLLIDRIVKSLGKHAAKTGGTLLLLMGLFSVPAAFVSLVHSEVPANVYLGYAGELFWTAIVFGSLCFSLHVTWILFRASIALFRITPHELSIVRGTHQGFSFLSKVLLRIWRLPPSAEFVQWRSLRFFTIVVLSMVSSAFFAAGNTFALFSSGVIKNSVTAATSATQVETMIFSGPFVLPAMVFLLLGAASIALRGAQRLVRLSLGELQKIDPRKPVLFLRAFRDDQVPLKPPKLSFYAWLLEIGRRKTNLDHMLLAEATPYGPVVALGSPHDKNPPYGAARAYFDTASWQEAVADLARNALAIVICIDDTEGIWWEIEHLKASRQLAKTLFVTHPSHMAVEANAKLMTKLAAILELDDGLRPMLLDPPADPKKRKHRTTVIGFSIDNNGVPCIMRSSTFSRFGYLYALRIFIRDILGLAPCPLPQNATGAGRRG